MNSLSVQIPVVFHFIRDNFVLQGLHSVLQVLIQLLQIQLVQWEVGCDPQKSYFVFEGLYLSQFALVVVYVVSRFQEAHYFAVRFSI